MSQHTGRRATREFQCVRIALLWHHARAGREALTELHEAEFARAIEDQIFSKARKVGTDKRRAKEQLGDEIPIAYRVDRVRRDVIEA